MAETSDLEAMNTIELTSVEGGCVADTTSEASFREGLPAGYLPRWLVFVAITSITNTVLGLFNPVQVGRRVYARSPLQVSRLAGRIFVTWTFLSAIIRLYGAYHIYNKQVYELVMISYAVAVLHLFLEFLFFDGVSRNLAGFSPILISVTTLVCLSLQYHHYTSGVLTKMVTDSNSATFDQPEPAHEQSEFVRGEL